MGLVEKRAQHSTAKIQKAKLARLCSDKIQLRGSLALFYRNVCADMRRVLAPGGRIALLTNAPQLASFHDLRCDGQFEISLYGQTPTILTFSSENSHVGAE